MAGDGSFRYLNVDEGWPHFVLDGVTVEDGVLRLTPVPGSPVAVGPALQSVEVAGSAGIAEDALGVIYVCDPGTNRVIRVDPCEDDGSSDGGGGGDLPCFDPRTAPGLLNTPRGLLAGTRHALYVVDAGHHRVLVIDLATFQVLGVWGQADLLSDPQPGAEPGRFDDPWDIAADSTQSIYVVDHGNYRVQKFDADGVVDPAFWATVAAQGEVPQEPRSISVADLGDGDRILLVDRTSGGPGPADRLLILRLDGTLDQARTDAWSSLVARDRDEGSGSVTETPLTEIAGAVFADGRLYAGDAQGRRVLVFDPEGRFVGEAGFRGTMAGLFVDRAGDLLVYPGAPGTVVRLGRAAARLVTGRFVSGPISADGDGPLSWQELRLRARFVPGAHLRLFTTTADQTMTLDPSSLPQAAAPGQPAPVSMWASCPADAAAAAIASGRARYLWVGGILSGDGAAEGTPTLQQIRVEYERSSWIRYLPAVYRRNEDSAAFLDRVLRLLESVERDDTSVVDSLPLLFDPLSSPNEGAPASWLDWLAGWLAVTLDESWPEAKRRDVVASAFELLALRGTPEGLRRLLELTIDAPVFISEPAAQASIWALGEGSSVLGFTSMLAAAEAQGAVVGATAVVDGSNLIAEQDYGEPLFEDLAHRFCVRAYAADLARPAAAEALDQVIQREKPAHTEHHVCVIEARARVGFQARVGVDTLVAGPPAPLALGGEGLLRFDVALDGSDQREMGGSIGEQARLGIETTLT